MSDELFSREEVLGGLRGREDRHLFRQIELRTAHLKDMSRRAVKALLTRKPLAPSDFDYYDAVQSQANPANRLNILDFEQFSKQWGEIVPASPEVRATLAYRFGTRFSFARKDVAGIRNTLGLDDPAVHQAYQSKYGEELESIYSPTTEASGYDDTDWAEGLLWLTPSTATEFHDELDWIKLGWGEILFLQGFFFYFLYLFFSLRVLVFVTMDGGDEQVVGEIGRGEIVGEMALLTNDDRSGTVIAIRDCELVRLSRLGFDRLLERDPRAVMQMTRDMVARLARQADNSDRERKKLHTIALIPTGPAVPIENFGERLSEALNAVAPTLRLNRRIFRDQFGQSISTELNAARQESLILWWLDEQEQQHRFVIYEADPKLNDWTRRCISHADRIYVVGWTSNGPLLSEVESYLFDPDVQRTIVDTDLILLHPDRNRRPSNTIDWLRSRPVDRHHHMAINHRPDYDRLARLISGKAIGLALGSGGARGAAHLGTLRALHEAGLPIDYVGGVSIGAIVGSGVAAGYDVDEIYEIFRDFSSRIRYLMDFTIPIVSAVSGRRINQTLRRHLGDLQLEDLWTPMFTVCINLNRGRPHLFKRGPAWRAVRASFAIPMVFSPILDNGDLLVDGGSYTNVPADLLLEWMGGDATIIGSNLIPKEEILEDYQLGDAVNSWRILWSRINPFISAVPVPSALDVLVHTTNFSNSYLRDQQFAASDLLIDLPVGHFGLFEFDRFDEMVALGYESAMRQLDEWLESQSADDGLELAQQP
ncbi:MAG: cyclic nucleotide-binding domain-containing protein [Chloroflexi bacterium]|nr:cyclic nucleotide-binding domain-containing protein [Chloroflexota bacterium]